MKSITTVLSILILTLLASCTSTDKEQDQGLDYDTFCFYYNWYGNKEHNEKDIHWAHGIISRGPNDTIHRGFIPGGEDIAANFWPQLGTYSSTDPQLVKTHMDMIKQARIGVIVLTWWGKADFGRQSVPLLLDEAAKAGIKVAFHIEPFGSRDASKTLGHIKEIVDTYGNHPAFYRKGDKPLFFIYDSYLTPAQEWETLLKVDGEISMRNTKYDAIMIGLWVKKGEEEAFLQSGFDGFYTYFGATDFTYGSTPKNWPYLQQFAEKNGKMFIPCVGPGYIDTRVRPWNDVTTRDREAGKYYDRMYQSAIDCGAPAIGITSFNEWHEGTQIEPAVPVKLDAFDYIDYSPVEPDYYLKRTAYWIEEAQKKKKTSKTTK